MTFDNSTHSDTSMGSSSSSKPWTDIVLACLAINLVTLLGVCLTAVTRVPWMRRHKQLMETLLVPSFAAGALLATAAFLLVPESLELLIHASEESHVGEEEHGHFRRLEEDHAAEEAHEDDASFAWKFGTALLGGFLLPLLLHSILPQAQVIVQECDECQEQQGDDLVLSPAATRQLVQDDDDDAIKAAVVDKEDLRTMESGCDAHECQHVKHCPPVLLATAAKEDDLDEACDEQLAAKGARRTTTRQHQQQQVNLPLTLSILLGDAIHNFTDGVFLANAFLLCSRDIAWTMVATTVYHEMAQELADFVVLTNHCGLSICKALILNFCSGLSILLGAVIILAADLSNAATGIILAVSGGVYLYITAVECVPRVLEYTKGNRRLFLAFLGMFSLGAIPIGLVLLNHGHCGSE
ncbi:hypothetical protein MPSEU_001035200 [Mayamaea pseudoterrestris]|nr:hypothetical protein MPSEU_001035200 [Mayamaea pseudoterrestris]